MMNHDSKTNEGFILVSLLPLLTFLLIVGSCIGATSLSLVRHKQNLQICRLQSVKAQKHLAEATNKLLALNTRAQSLRIQRKRAEQMMASAEPTIASAGAALFARVLLLQAALASQQKQILTIGPSHASYEWLNAQAQLVSASARLTQVPRANLKLFATPSDSLTPDYHPIPAYSLAQKQTLSWQIPLAAFLPMWLGRFISINQVLEGKCTTTLVQAGQKWQSQLVQDKFF